MVHEDPIWNSPGKTAISYTALKSNLPTRVHCVKCKIYAYIHMGAFDFLFIHLPHAKHFSKWDKCSCLDSWNIPIQHKMHVGKLPVTWSQAVVFAGYSGFLHYLQLASHELALIGINVTKNKIPYSTQEALFPLSITSRRQCNLSTRNAKYGLGGRLPYKLLRPFQTPTSMLRMIPFL